MKFLFTLTITISIGSALAFQQQPLKSRVVVKQSTTISPLQSTAGKSNDDNNIPKFNIDFNSIKEKANFADLKAKVGDFNIGSSSSNKDGGKSKSSLDLRVPDMSGLTDKLSLPDLTSVFKNSDKIIDNVTSGEMGKRGEGYVAAQAVIFLLIVFGSIPIIGDPINLILGPGLLLIGIYLCIAGVTELGPALSPWLVSNDNNKNDIITDGVYGLIRHPTYAGLIAIGAGLSIITGSATRLLLTCVLYYVLDIKSTKEEDDLLNKLGPEYKIYQKQVPGKFFPQDVLDQLPWNK